MKLFHIAVLTLLCLSHGTALAQSVQEKPATAPTQTEQERQKVFNAESFTLDNGMQVVVIPNDRVPVVTHMVWYKVGAANEPAGKSGIAHFLEHLMFKGSKVIGGDDLPPGEFSKIVRGMGGRDNAFTSQDYTAYFQSVPADKLETVMRMEAGRMRGMQLPEAEVTAERKVILEERRQRTDNKPSARFGEQLAAAAFKNHPYGTPIIGWAHEMEELSRDDAFAFYNQWYRPNNAILIVSGDVTPAAVFAKAIDIYGPISKGDLPARDYTRSPPAQALNTIVMRDKAVRQPTVQTLYRADSAQQNKKNALAMEVLAEIMGGGSTSRLYRALVAEQKIASSAGLSYDSTRFSDSSVWVYATPLPEQPPEKIEEALKAELRKLVKNGVKAQELKDAISRMRDAAIYARDSLSGPAMVIGRALVTGSSLEMVEYWPDDIAEVTREDVQKVAALFLDPDKPHDIPPVTGYLLPESEDE